MEKVKFRHEIKHWGLPVTEKKIKMCHEDGYFDTPADKALMEKIDGVDNREKIRIRLYNHDDSFIKLEKKIKVNGKYHKRAMQRYIKWKY